MPRSVVWSLYAGCVLVWSSTWVVIAVGLDGVAPFLGAGIRFALAGLGVLTAARLLGRPLKTDFRLAALVAALPFATSYGLIYWAEQYVPSGLTAVLFGVLPLYMALLAAVTLPEEPLRRGARLEPLAQGPPKKIRSVRGGPAVDAWRRRRAQACTRTLSLAGGVRRRGWAASGRTGVLGRALIG